MREGKLRIGPTCYHTLHIVPIMAAHEMNLLSDEGLKTADGSRAYEILRDPMVPFGLEKLGISQGMKERSVDIALDVQSRTIFFQRARGADIYIIAGWRNQVPGVMIGPPHIKSLKDLKAIESASATTIAFATGFSRFSCVKPDWTWSAMWSG